MNEWLQEKEENVPVNNVTKQMFCKERTVSMFNYEDVKSAMMTKHEMYLVLSGKNVKCIYTESENVGLFAVQDIVDGKVYLLDNFNTN